MKHSVIYKTYSLSSATFVLMFVYLLFTGSTAFSQNINIPNKTGAMNLQVNSLSGNLFFSRNDVYIPARMFDLNISFHYNSFNFDSNTGYGNGWSFMYDIRYKNDTASGKIIVWGDGREDSYVFTGSSYKSPVGFFNVLQQYQSGKFSLTETDGTILFFDNSLHKRITRMQEPNGNFINFNYTDTLLTSLSNNAGQTISFAYDSKARLITITDAIASPSRSWTYSYDASNNLTQVTDPLGAKNKYTYIINGPVKSVTDKNNNVVDVIYYNDYTVSELIGCNKRLSFSYDTTQNTTIVTDYLQSGNNQITKYKFASAGNNTWLAGMSSNCCGFDMGFEYDAAGNKIKETDANGNVTKFTYDAKGNVKTITDALNQTTTFTYSSDFHRVNSITDAKGFVTTITYDAKGNALQITEPGNLIYTAVYNSNGDITSSTDPRGQTYTYTYDAYGNPLTVNGPNGLTAAFGFDARGNLITYTDANSNTSTLQYDILSRMKQLTDPLNNNIQLSYDAMGNATTIKNKNNENSLLKFDASNRLTEYTNELGNKIKILYDGMDNVISLTDAVGNTTTFTYDTRNRLSGMKDAEGNEVTYNYDGNGNIIATNLPTGQRYNYSYDALNRIKSITDASSTISQFEYDANDNITKITNATGATVQLAYDSVNRIRKMTDPLGNNVELTYDKNGNVTSIKDRKGTISNIVYDNRNRVINFTDNNGSVTTVGYDAVGNITSLKDANNNTTTYTYDALNRVKRMTYPDGNFTENTFDVKDNVIARRLTNGATINYTYDSLNRVVSKILPDGQVYSYTYDAVGRITSASNAAGTIMFTYDVLNRVTSETFNGRTVKYSYSISGRTQTTIYPDSTVITRNFDTRNRLTSIQKNGSAVVSYQYNNADQVISKTFANGVTTNMQYDFANRLINISTGAFQNISFTYDANGNKTSVTRSSNNKSEQFTYDNGNRLTGYKQGPAGGPFSINNSYTYDALGNRTTAVLNGVTTNYTNNNLNQMLSSNNGVQNINYVYDGNGNLAFDGKFYKTYDAEKRLLKDSSSPTTVIIYTYDAMGRRTIKSLNGAALNYTYAGMEQIEERNASGVLQNRTIFKHFLEPVVNEKNNLPFYYHSNDLMSIEFLTNAAGTLAEQYDYDVYGKQKISDGAGNTITGSNTGNRFGFTGQVYDSATATNKFFFREYNPATGLFNQRDLIGYGDGMGMYQYVGNNPANGVDIFGLKDCPPEESIDWLKVSETTISFENGFQGYAELLMKLAIRIRQSKDVNEIKDLQKKYDKLYNVLQRMLDKSKFKIAESLAEKGDAILGEINSIKNGANLKGLSSTLKNLGRLGFGLNVADLGVKAYNFSGELGKYSSGQGEATDLGMSFANLGQSAFSFTPYGAAVNLFDFTQQQISGKPLNEHLADAAQWGGRNSFKDKSSEQEIEMEEWYRKQGKIQTYMRIKREQFRKEYLKNKKPDCPQNGNPGGSQGKPRFRINPVTGQLEVIAALDPNEIIGPSGEPNKRWVSVKDRLPYTVTYENDKSATAPAKYIKVFVPVHNKMDAASFELKNIGFNSLTFTVPPATASNYQRLDCRDSLGLFVDMTAGYDVVKNQFFWEFQSIDPVTLLPPSDPLKGFLLRQDSANSLYGHGFVNFSIKPVANAQTLDSILAQAFIIFDTNDTIPTNIEKNTIDAKAPTSNMNSLGTNYSGSIPLSWIGADHVNGCGIRYFTLYVSSDGVNFNIVRSGITRRDTVFTGTPNTRYYFFVLATDSVGNTETLRPGAVVSTQLGTTLPVTWLYFNGTTKNKNNVLTWATASEQNTDVFKVERSFDAVSFATIGTVKAAGNSPTTSTYQYIDENIDKLSKPVFYYRLKQVDLDGRFNYSSIIRLTYNEQTTAKSMVYPNPTNGIITIVVGDKKLIGSTARVFDEGGRLLQTVRITTTAQSVNLSNYFNGIYFIILDNKESLKIIKQ